MKLTAFSGSNNDGLFKAENGTIWFRKYRAGRGEIYRSLKTKDLTRARVRRNEMMEELWGDKPLKVRRQTVGEIWAAWYQGIAETKSNKTAEGIRSAWMNFDPYLSHMFLDEVTSEWWTNVYIPRKRNEPSPERRPNQDMSKRKFFNERKYLGMCLKWADENGRGQAGWRRPKFKNPDPPIAEAKIYNEKQLEALRLNASQRMLAMLEMGEKHFMRRSEAIHLEWLNVSFEDRSISLRAEQTKIRKARALPVNRVLMNYLHGLKAASDGSLWVFPSIFQKKLGNDLPTTFGEFTKQFTSVKTAAGLSGTWKFHWLRHTGLTKAFKKPNSSAALICHFAGLSLDEAQRTYLHYTLDDLRGVEDLAD